MSGKGDKRRPQSVSDESLERLWTQAFEKKTWTEWMEFNGDIIKSPDVPNWRKNPENKMSFKEYLKGLPYCTKYQKANDFFCK